MVHYPQDFLYFETDLNRLLINGAIEDAVYMLNSSIFQNAPTSVVLPTTPQFRFLLSYAILPACLVPAPGRTSQISQKSISQQIVSIINTVMQLTGILPPTDPTDALLVDTTKLSPDRLTHSSSSLDRSFDPVFVFYAMLDLQFEGLLPLSWQIVDPTSGELLDSGKPGVIRKNINGITGPGRRKSVLGGGTGAGAGPLETETIGGRLQTRSASRKAKKDIDQLFSVTSSLMAKTQNNTSFSSVASNEPSFNSSYSGNGNSDMSNDDDEDDDLDLELLNFDSDEDVDMTMYKYTPKFPASEVGVGEAPGDLHYTIKPLKFDDLLFTWPTLKLNCGFLGWIFQYDSHPANHRNLRFAALRPVLDLVLSILEHNIQTTALFDSPSIFYKWISAESSPRRIATLLIANPYNVSPETLLTFRPYLPHEEIVEYERRQRERAQGEEPMVSGGAEAEDTLNNAVWGAVINNSGPPESTPPQRLPNERIVFRSSFTQRARLATLISRGYSSDKDRAIYFEFAARRMIEHLTPSTLYSLLTTPCFPLEIVCEVAYIMFNRRDVLDPSTQIGLSYMLRSVPDVILEKDLYLTIEMYLVILKAVLVLRTQGPAAGGGLAAGGSATGLKKRKTKAKKMEVDDVEPSDEEIAQAAAVGKACRRRWLPAPVAQKFLSVLTGLEADVAMLVS